MVRVRVRHLVLMVKVRVRGWEMHYVNECPHKYNCTNVHVCVALLSAILMWPLVYLWSPEGTLGCMSEQVWDKLFLHKPMHLYFLSGSHTRCWEIILENICCIACDNFNHNTLLTRSLNCQLLSSMHKWQPGNYSIKTCCASTAVSSITIKPAIYWTFKPEFTVWEETKVHHSYNLFYVVWW